MSKADFEAAYKSLGLDALEGSPTDVTFVPATSTDTVMSAPKVEAAPAALSGTLPRLQLQTPDAVQLGPDDAELVAVQVLGEGGMGRVLLARQSSLGRDVAVKVLRGGGAGSEAAAETLIAEARTTGSLEHPSVVPVYALARDGGGQPALVMKRVEGVSWRELLHDPKHPAWQKLSPGRDRLAFHVEVLVQVCNAIAHAHQRGVIHRDVKPANVLLGELGETYLADWGVALERRKVEGLPTRLVGTPAYLAPEMVRGDPKLMDERTDVYLLGATLHEVLTGAPPHVGTNLRDVMQHAWDSPPPSLPADAPELLAAACRRAMSADPNARHPTATALRDELKRFLAHRGSTELSRAASKRLVELEAMDTLSTDPAAQRRWYTLVTECRFGFAQALEASPDHAEARDGLRRCLEVAVRHELARGAGASARAYLSELEAPPAELVASVEQLEAQERERAAAQAHLQRMAHEHDVEVSRGQRTRVLFALVGAVALMVLAFAATARRENVEAQYDGWFRLVPLCLTSTVYLIAAVLGRKSLFSTVINRQFMALLGVGAFGTLLHRLFSVWVGMSSRQSLTEDSVMLAVLAALGGLTLHRTLWLPAACFAAGAVGCLLVPGYTVAVFGLSSGLAIGSVAVVMTFWSNPKP